MLDHPTPGWLLAGSGCSCPTLLSPVSASCLNRLPFDLRPLEGTNVQAETILTNCFCFSLERKGQCLRRCFSEASFIFSCGDTSCGAEVGTYPAGFTGHSARDLGHLPLLPLLTFIESFFGGERECICCMLSRVQMLFLALRSGISSGGACSARDQITVCKTNALVLILPLQLLMSLLVPE